MKRPKYGNRETVVDGISFPSAKEAKRWGELQLLARAGEITDLQRQVRFSLKVNGELVTTYVADFTYFERGASRVTVEDTKGFRTREYIIKRKLMKACFGIDIKET